MHQLDPHRGTPAYHQAVHRIQHSIAKVFRRQKGIAIASTKRLLKMRVFKAEDDSSEFDPGATAESIYEDVFEAYRNVPSEIRPALEHSMLSGINTGILQLEVHDTNLIAAANNIASKYAEERAAELVGMKYNEDGELVENPNAEWAISDTTRDKLKRVVRDAFEGETSIAEVSKKIQAALEADESKIFTDERAMTIARTEVANAQAAGNFEVWKQTGLVETVKWTVSADEPCDICEDNEDQVVEFGTAFNSGDILPPAHPNCRCVLVAVKISDGE